MLTASCNGIRYGTISGRAVAVCLKMEPKLYTLYDTGHYLMLDIFRSWSEWWQIEFEEWLLSFSSEYIISSSAAQESEA
jgi:hypothetical protein